MMEPCFYQRFSFIEIQLPHNVLATFYLNFSGSYNKIFSQNISNKDVSVGQKDLLFGDNNTRIYIINDLLVRKQD